MDAPRPPQPHFPSPYRRPQTAPCWVGHVTTDDGARIAAFERASRYEWMFWDAAWRQEAWPI